MPGSDNSSSRSPGLPLSTKGRREHASVSKLHVVTAGRKVTLPKRIEAKDAGSSDSQPADMSSRISSMSKLVLDTVGEGIFCVDAGGRATFVNPAAARMTGWLAEELIGKSQHAMVHHSHADGSEYPVETCQIYAALHDGSGSQSREDEVFWRKDGTSFPVSYSSTPMVIDGIVSGAVVVFRDISERTRRERWQRGKDEVLQAITVHRPVEQTLQILADALYLLPAGLLDSRSSAAG